MLCENTTFVGRQSESGLVCKVIGGCVFGMKNINEMIDRVTNKSERERRRETKEEKKGLRIEVTDAGVGGEHLIPGTTGEEPTDGLGRERE